MNPPDPLKGGRFERYLRHLKSSPDYQGQIEHVQRIPARVAQYADAALPLNPRLAARLDEQGISRLYSHQAAALDAVRAGQHAMVVTSTASGKTLCYNVPVVETILQDPTSHALYLFPTKALAQDQLGKLNDLGFFPEVRFATYDGDTPQADRRFIKRGAHIVLTNPDMLHVGILPYHTSWAKFFAGLKYVVLDELHTYRGVFGSHVAQIVRRLRRICGQYGANPQFITCSATIGNPGELMERLTGLKAEVIDNDGAPRGERTFVLWNPPLLGPGGERRSSNVEATGLFTDLVANGIRNITFAKARKSAELILRYAREVFREKAPELAARVMSYRAGYTPDERRKIEQGLFHGELLGVTATNALELGVDVGGLDATVLTGYPGTIASTWQQAGRAGRSGEEALSVLIALDGPLDQFLVRHPEYFFGRVHEHAIVDPDNARIQSQHLVCAAYESPLAESDLPGFGPKARQVVDELAEAGKLQCRNGRWYYRGDRYPAADVNIRSASNSSFEIRTIEGRLIGSVESSRAYQTIHPGAIYLHQGDTFEVRRLDEDEMVATVAEIDANHYTEPRDVTFISVSKERASKPLGITTAYFGDVTVMNQVLGYRVKQVHTEIVLDVVDLELPEQVYETEAFWFTVPATLVAEIGKRGLDLCGAIHAAEHAAIGMMPLLVTCDRWDVGGVSTPHHPDTGMATIFIYDGYPGGVGIAESSFERLAELLETTRTMISECLCEDGCPSCIQSPKCGNNNEPLDKAGALLLLKELLPLAREQGIE